MSLISASEQARLKSLQGKWVAGSAQPGKQGIDKARLGKARLGKVRRGKVRRARYSR